MKTSEPLLEGEQMQRSYSRYYPNAFRKAEPREVDFSVVPELRALAQNIKPESTAVRTRTLAHLDDAENEALPMYARKQHFDIAGALVWNHGVVYNVRDRNEPWFVKFFKIFTRAGGI